MNLDKVPNKTKNILSLIYIIITFLKSSVYIKTMQKYFVLYAYGARLYAKRVTTKLFIKMNV